MSSLAIHKVVISIVKSIAMHATSSTLWRQSRGGSTFNAQIDNPQIITIDRRASNLPTYYLVALPAPSRL